MPKATVTRLTGKDNDVNVTVYENVDNINQTPGFLHLISASAKPITILNSNLVVAVEMPDNDTKLAL